VSFNAAAPVGAAARERLPTSVRRRQPERGAVTPAIVVACLLASALSLGGITLGRMAAVRSDAQRSADAAALAALQVIKERGLPFDARAKAAAEAIARANTPNPVAITWQVNETADAVTITALATVEVDTPRFVFLDGTTQVQGRASASLAQTKFDTAERRLPKLSLVLDYSGSMDLPFSGGGARAIDVLEDSVEGLLNAGLEIEYGAVFYSSNVFRTVPVSPGAPNQIMSTMNSYDAGGNTNTAAGLAAAGNLLQAVPDTGRYVLLVSDGEPNDFGSARNAAAALWDRDMTIFTLEIRRSGSGAALDQFMTDVAGTPTNRRDRNYHYVATSAAQLVQEFRRIVSTIVCKVGPLSPAPSDPAGIRVFLREGTIERAVPATDDLGRDVALERYRYESTDLSVRLTATACDAVLERGAAIVVRSERPGLTQ